MKTYIPVVIFFLMFTTAAIDCDAQLAAKIAEGSFKKFDANKSGWLSGNELISCNCKQYDTDGDNEVTLQEFFTGQGIKSPATTSTANANKPYTPAKEQPVTNRVQVNTNGTGTNRIKGAWWFTAMLEGNGKVYQLRNRMSGLDLKENGQYVLNTWLGGANNMRTVGTYNHSGNRLTLNRSNGDVANYTLSFDADGTMTMEDKKGLGYKAKRSNK